MAEETARLAALLAESSSSDDDDEAAPITSADAIGDVPAPAPSAPAPAPAPTKRAPPPRGGSLDTLRPSPPPSLEALISAHDASRASELAIDYVWEQQALKTSLVAGWPVSVQRAWLPAEWDGPGTELAALFAAAGGDGGAIGGRGLPDASWAWAAPRWLVDNRNFGLDRMVDGRGSEEGTAAEGAWLYAVSWDAGRADGWLSSAPLPAHKVRCRRHVRPRERRTAAELNDLIGSCGVADADVQAAFARHRGSGRAADVIDLSAALEALGADVTPPVDDDGGGDDDDEEGDAAAENAKAPSFFSRLRASSMTRTLFAAAAISEPEPEPTLLEPPLPVPRDHEIVIDTVWEQQVRPPADGCACAAVVAVRHPSHPPLQRWVPSITAAGKETQGWKSSNLLRRLPFASSRRELVDAFAAAGGPPDDDAAGLPGSGSCAKSGRSWSWRWLSKWVVESRCFGSDRTVKGAGDGGGGGGDGDPDGWIYAMSWPADDVGYARSKEFNSTVRCRRWVRPREAWAAGAGVGGGGAAGAPPAFLAGVGTPPRPPPQPGLELEVEPPRGKQLRVLAV